MSSGKPEFVSPSGIQKRIECVVTNGLGYRDNPDVVGQLAIAAGEIITTYRRRGSLLYRAVNDRELGRPLTVGNIDRWSLQALADQLASAQAALYVMGQRAQHGFPDDRNLLPVTSDYDWRTFRRETGVVHPDRQSKLIYPIEPIENQFYIKF